ncbi:MAG: hypothetical protein MUF51_05635, partial [Vicinamibacteria bacterium]|nr:hypothetical protein [Vicinamibacteria bacterium]
ETARDLDPNLCWAYYATGCVHAKRGESDVALQFIAQALQKGLKDFKHIDEDHDLDTLRSDSKFQDLLARYRNA